MTSWFSGGASAKKTQAPKQQTPPNQEWPCACEHCYGIISKLPAPSGEVKEVKEAKKEKPTWQAAARLLGALPQGYSRYPFLEQYAENVLQLQRHQVLRLRIQDLKTVLSQKRIVLPELFDYPEADYEGPKEAPPAAPTTVIHAVAAPVASVGGGGLDVDLLVSKLTEALSSSQKKKKKDKKKKKHHRRRREEAEEAEEAQEEEDGEGEDPEEGEEGEEEEEEVQEERRRGGGRRR